MIEEIIDLLKISQSIQLKKKKEILDDLKYMSDWQLEELQRGLMSLIEEEHKFESDVARIDMKYKIKVENEVAKS